MPSYAKYAAPNALNYYYAHRPTKPGEVLDGGLSSYRYYLQNLPRYGAPPKPAPGPGPQINPIVQPLPAATPTTPPAPTYAPGADPTAQATGTPSGGQPSYAVGAPQAMSASSAGRSVSNYPTPPTYQTGPAVPPTYNPVGPIAPWAMPKPVPNPTGADPNDPTANPKPPDVPGGTWSNDGSQWVWKPATPAGFKPASIQLQNGNYLGVGQIPGYSGVFQQL